jgi:hypothetical protein
MELGVVDIECLCEREDPPESSVRGSCSTTGLPAPEGLAPIHEAG